ncbi:hypothetical protein QVD17_38893 [Tagetes erecta]|uniref:non-specific serine/threonine protein kinase n=1 Tax=Tagetes erecta TaxID=13708 RepID=A0AAD8JPP7_TARER|nr:hypothetical protein QVD17_38893 [Tagetes erecta]
MFSSLGLSPTPLDFPLRLRISIGFARGLAYLHEERSVRMIHRDIKPASILLDHKFDAVIADFGISRIKCIEQSFVSTVNIAGTPRYMDLEYELITGLHPGKINVVEMRTHLTQALETGIFDGVVDTKLGADYNVEDMRNMLDCASLCVRDVGNDRPRMSMVLKLLKGAIAAWEVIEEFNQAGQPTTLINHMEDSRRPTTGGAAPVAAK